MLSSTGFLFLISADFAPTTPTNSKPFFQKKFNRAPWRPQRQLWTHSRPVSRTTPSRPGCQVLNHHQLLIPVALSENQILSLCPLF
jgi:hypothetical protein